MSAEETGEATEIEDLELAELVAYLDGELPPAEMDRMQQRLIHDDVLRRRAESLDRTWRLLDDFGGDVSASSEFTARTLQTMQATQAEEGIAGAGHRGRLSRQPIRPLLQFAVWALAGFLMTSVIVSLARTARDARQDSATRQVLLNLDMLRRYPQYRAVRDLDTLNGLRLGADAVNSDAESPSEGAVP